MRPVAGIYATLWPVPDVFSGESPPGRNPWGEESELVVMNDPVADALIRIKNGYSVGKVSVAVSFSKMILKFLKLLQKEGYIQDVEQKKNEILVMLKYNSRIPALTDVKRISKPSLRVYKGVKDLPHVLNGLGIAIISTPKGLMTDREARKLKVGGEVLALIW